MKYVQITPEIYPSEESSKKKSFTLQKFLTQSSYKTDLKHIICRNKLIEKKELEEKYKLLLADYKNLTDKIEKIENQDKINKQKQIEFSEKIDELNQETDILLGEMDKWQM